MQLCGTINTCLYQTYQTIIIWNNDDLSLSINNEKIYCPKYAAPILAYTILHNECDYYKYPIYLVKYFLNDIKISNFKFTIFDKNDEISIKRYTDLDIIVTDMLVNGLWPDHVDLAKEYNIYDGLKTIIDYQYKL